MIPGERRVPTQARLPRGGPFGPEFGKTGLASKLQRPGEAPATWARARELVASPARAEVGAVSPVDVAPFWSRRRITIACSNSPVL